MKYFLKYDEKLYSDEDLIQTFYQLGIKKGDILCVHSELIKFGIPLLSKNEFLQTIIDCFFEVIGKEGTLIMPTFTYSFCKNGIYDKLNSKSEVGILTEYFRNCKGVKRTNDPIFSFAIKGAKQELFLKDTTSCFGKDCVYEILTKENGKIILFGMDNSGYTIIHYLEEVAKVPYRYFKNFNGILIDENKLKSKININYYVRKLDEKSEMDIPKHITVLKKQNNFKKIYFSKSPIIVIESKKYFNDMIKILNNNKYCFL